MKTKNKNGFSLLELLVVVVIVGILAAVSIPFYQRAVLRSHAAEVNNLLTMVRSRQTSKFAQDKKYASVFTDPALTKIALGPEDYEENSGAVKTVNGDYILKLRTNDDKDFGCVTGTYSPDGEDKFTFAIAYTKAGLGCTDAANSSYSVCGSFGNTVVGSVDEVCSLSDTQSNNNTTQPQTSCDTKVCPGGFQFVDCKCVPCEEKPKPGYQFAGEGCEWKACEPCKEGFHFVEGCNCEEDSSSCDSCPGNQILVDNDTCKCACPKETPLWDEDSKKCIECKDPTTWDPKSEKCVCPKKTPVLFEDPETDTVKCVTCEESKPNSVWNEKEQTCQCSCTGGRILVKNDETDKIGDKDKESEECNCVCPSQNPIWDKDKQQCGSCPEATPFYDEKTKKCLSCYDKYGQSTPVWDAQNKQCVSCYSKFPGKVVCSLSTLNEIANQYEYSTKPLSDFNDKTFSSINSYALKTGALLAAANKPKCGATGPGNDSTTFINETPQCKLAGQHTPCRYTCVPLGLANMEGLVDSCGANLSNGGMDSCTCDPGVGWICPNQCELIEGGYYETSVFQPIGCNMEPTVTCNGSLPDLTGWTSQGSCYDTWHNAKQYEPAKPVWIANSGYPEGGYCASCGQVSVTTCSAYTGSTGSTGCGITYDHFSGSVWNGTACVNLPSNYYLEDQSCVSLKLLPIAKCYSNDGSCEPACYWNRENKGPSICSIGGSNYEVSSKNSATANIRNVLSSSTTDITQVYRQSYDKDYYALKELNIMPGLKGNVITK